MKKALISIIVLVWIEARGQEAKPLSLEKLPPHPRLLLVKEEEKALLKIITEDMVWSKMHSAILQESESIIDKPCLERVQIGRRLLDKSRECIRRVFYLSYAYRFTGQEKYFRRAEKEMLVVSAFTDWNPSHFLDVAEMTLALAIGYDWLFDRLPEDSKQIIREAIVKKGLEPSFDERYNWFLRVTHNWNQVCNAGMLYGALAIAEHHPDISKQIIDWAIKTIRLSMEDYQPDGAYAEGYNYWGYGTSFNVLFLSALEKAFSSDFGLLQSQGFLKTAAYFENMTGVTGAPFNWGDCGSRKSFSPAMLWFAKKNNDPSLLWVEKDYLKEDDYSRLVNDRLLPAAIIWGKDVPLDKITSPTSKMWVGRGANPVALMRTSWTDANGIYLGFKAGSAGVNHAHMDIGSFVMESDGVRWASDFGLQDYESLESKGIELFGRAQDAQRWTIFRLNNFVHNTLTVDSQLQLVKGYAKINRHADKPSFSYAISDLSTIYENQLAHIERGVGIVDERYVVIQDELTTLDKPTKVRWTMLTTATVASIDNNVAILTKNDKQLTLQVDSPVKIVWKTWSTQPTTNYDAPNPGTTLIGFEIEVPPGKKGVLTVKLIPRGAEKKAKAKIKPMQQWP
jgi:hypothetical protein